ncbi:hypothetical protein Acid345_2752 [Candidatus Koribacter versatilis Ellin345]|uniref:Uncharacterized protein n=1 Tax=Koribacter versatilis (strain Ellin345) TaxID=204669 RepID=Q1IMZ7_KORVE|nr:hypothetical protein [Candidatus Koribacter versatilis]ABF41753.1 hypothetical protein Acid345_2752 [Candidatus Koribacter versatilis Ellin345]
MYRLLALTLLTAATAAAQIDVGYRLHSSEVPRASKQECATSPAQTYPCFADVTLGGTKFNVVAYDDRRLVRYLFTTDAAFSTKTGLHVGDWVEVDEKDVVLVPGWHICGPRTADGWRLVFGSDLDESEKQVTYEDGTPVNFIHTIESSPKRGKLRIVGFEKGEV